MNNRKQEATYLERYWIFILYALGGLVQYCLSQLQTESSGNKVNSAITIGFFVIILGLFIIAFLNLQKGLKFRSSLWEATEKIWKLFDEKKETIKEEIFSDESFFNHDELTLAFETYKADTEKMKALSADTNVDIENYINQKLLEDSIGINFLDQIAGAMTGLGILGTFIGLAIGLSQFNIGSGDIGAELQPLMDGIKIAFHTSIIGLVYSLIYGFIYNKQLFSEKMAVDEFLEEYRKYVVPVTESGSTETFIRYQQKLVELLGAQIVNQQEDAEFGKIIAGKIDNVVDAIGSFVKKTQEGQREELEKLVNDFVEQMHHALGDSFASLGGTIKETTEWQKRMMTQMSIVLNQINNLAADLATINKSIEGSIKSVSDFTEKIDTMQAAINENMKDLNSRSRINTELSIQAKEKLTQISVENEHVILALQNFLKEAEKQSSSIQNMNQILIESGEKEMQRLVHVSASAAENIGSTTLKYLEETKQANEVNLASLKATYNQMEKEFTGKLNQLIDMKEIVKGDIEKATRELTAAAHGLNDDMAKQINSALESFDTNLARATTHLSGTIKDMDEATANVPIVINDTYMNLEKILKEMQIHLDQYLKYTNQMQRSLEQKAKQLQ